MICSWFFWPFYQSSALYRAVNCTTTSWICRTSPGTSPYIFVKPLIWISVAQAFLILSLKYSINFNWLSSQTPNYQVFSLWNIIFLSPTLILVSCSCSFSCCWCDLEKNIPSVFTVSYVTAFALPHCKTVLATFSKIWAISLIKDSEAINS